ncbi:hypothetical protein SLE2022_208190 [Rubroshorea leprosula]
MFLPQLFTLLFPFILTVIFILVVTKTSKSKYPPSKPQPNLPKSYPGIGSYLATKANRSRRLEWATGILQHSSSATFTISHPLGLRQIYTANPANVQYILKTHFPNYQKGILPRAALFDFLGDGIFNVNGDSWKFQRQVASHEFNTKSLRRFVETVVNTELSDRLIPMLSDAAENRTVLDFQDILQRFAFDNICRIAFGYDPAYLLPSLPQAEFAQSFDDGTNLSSERVRVFHPILWKIKRLFGIGSERRLRIATSEVRDFAKNIVREKKTRTQTEILARISGSFIPILEFRPFQ